jgi:predicted nucleic acid-binding protein
MPQKKSLKENDVYESLLNLKIKNPYYYKQHGITLKFVIISFFCSKIESIERNIIYILYIANVIKHEELKAYKDKINQQVLKKLLKHLIGNEKIMYKKDFREMIGIKSSETFKNYFDDSPAYKTYVTEHSKYLKTLDPKTRKLTLNEILELLEFWQGIDKKGRIQAYTKEELGERLFENYSKSYQKEQLELLLDKHITNHTYNEEYSKTDYYKAHDFIKPEIVINFLNELRYETDINLEEDTYGDEHELFFLFGLYIIKTFKLK